MKAELITAKKNLVKAKKGHDLLEIKQNALSHELRILEKSKAKILENFNTLKKFAEKTLKIASTELGQKNVKELILSKPTTPLPYDLSKTTTAIDDAYFAQTNLSLVEAELKKIETKENTLKEKLKRTKKRVSALRNISIPKYEKHVIFLTSKIEEYERDELIRIKTALPT